MRSTIISWNVNGLRQRYQMSQFLPVFHHNPDIVCVQETKTAGDKIPAGLKNLYGYHCYYDKKNPEKLTEVMLFSRKEPEHVTFGFGSSPFDNEGRIIIAEYETFTLMNMYFPLGKRPADTLEHNLAFYDAFLAYVARMNEIERKVIVCGDFSVARTDRDVSKPGKKVAQRVGITPPEREKLDQLIGLGFSDTLRSFSDADSHYSWRPDGFCPEDRSRGWRLDYFFVNTFIRPFVTGSEILVCYEGADHFPVMMEMEMPEFSSSGTVKMRDDQISQNLGLPV